MCDGKSQATPKEDTLLPPLPRPRLVRGVPLSPQLLQIAHRLSSSRVQTAHAGDEAAGRSRHQGGQLQI